MHFNSIHISTSKIAIFITIFLISCSAPQVQQDDISIIVLEGSLTNTISAVAGSTAKEALESAGYSLNLLDKSEPPLFTIMTDRAELKLIRVEENFIIEEDEIPFKQLELVNESLIEGQRRLVQQGEAGVEELTYRQVIEDGIEISYSLFERVIIIEPVTEIVMLGRQAPFSVVPISGKLAYISAGNAWVMEINTGFRTPIVTSGDLDEKVFSLSSDRNWLLYTRSDKSEDIINTLWVINIDSESDELSELPEIEISSNVLFAEWVPNSINGITFSTAEPNPNPPGWQANNDLNIVNFSTSGWVSQPRNLIPSNSGGVYGWWGTTFRYSPDGEQLAFSRPDSIGLVDFERDSLVPEISLLPFRTTSDWAWVPKVAWSPDGNYLFHVIHRTQPGLTSPEDSQLFDLAAFPFTGKTPISLALNTGMWGIPIPSNPIDIDGQSYDLAYLRAISPTQSGVSGYQLMVMDQDGSNDRLIFPPNDSQGLEPQEVIWAPKVEEMDETLFTTLALIFEGNIWLVNSTNAPSRQLTGDGLVKKIDWK